MSRKVLSVLLVSILFLFSSCGMPSYHDYSSSISISRAPTIVNGKSYDAGFSVRVSSSDPSVSSLSSETPSILIMYCIASGRGSFSSQFNSYIRNSNNYYNGTAASFNNSGQLNNVETTVDSHEVHLYHFTGEASRPLHDPAGYTYPSLKLDTTYYFMFEKVDNQDNTICLHLTVLESGSSDLMSMISIMGVKNLATSSVQKSQGISAGSIDIDGSKFDDNTMVSSNLAGTELKFATWRDGTDGKEGYYD